MAVKKHTLKTRTDKLNGVNGEDLFLAPALKGKATLSNSDVLNGKNGIDTINAFLGGTSLAPKLANIEIGIFSRKSTADMTLDLLNATAMNTITLKNFRSDAIINNATALSSFSAVGTKINTFTLNGLDTTKVSLQKLNFDSALGTTVEINTLNGANLANLDLTLKDSIVLLGNKAIATAMTVHSNGSQGNLLIFNEGITNTTDALIINGAADLTILAKQDSDLSGLTVFNASLLTGDLEARFGGAALTTITGGTGKDELTVLSLAATANVSLQTGDDVLDLRSANSNFTNMKLNGGLGIDTLRISGTATALNTTSVAEFEKLDITNARDTYTLTASFTSLSFIGNAFTGGNGDAAVIIDGGTALTSIIGDAAAQLLRITALGGNTAKKALVSMGDGNDRLELGDLILNSATQFFDGGLGINDVLVNGNIANLATLFDNFQSIHITNVTGVYDFAGTDFKSIRLSPATIATATTLDKLTTATQLLFYDNDFGASLTVNVLNAATDQTESLTVSLNDEYTLGGLNGGLTAASLSDLQIASNGGTNSNASTVYLSALGSATDTASITISGNKEMILIGTTGAANFIDTVNVTNTFGVDIAGLSATSFAFDTLTGKGAAISGGLGDDRLIGGLGADTFNLSLGGGDTLVFKAQTESAYSLAGTTADIVTGFISGTGANSDRIDLSALNLGAGSFTIDGNVADNTLGAAYLAANAGADAFFNTTTKTLYIDVSADNAAGAGDMEIKLTGVSGLVVGDFIFA